MLRIIDEELWKNEVSSKPKLRLYVQLKSNKVTEKYVRINLTPSERSFIAQLRFGILPLAVETGRFSRTALQNRTCPFCPALIEDELHFLFACGSYTSIRQNFLKDSNLYIPATNLSKLIDQMCSECPRKFAKYIKKCFHFRKNSILINS